jgi:hypothetical protein
MELRSNDLRVLMLETDYYREEGIARQRLERTFTKNNERKKSKREEGVVRRWRVFLQSRGIVCVEQVSELGHFACFGQKLFFPMQAWSPQSRIWKVTSATSQSPIDAFLRRKIIFTLQQHGATRTYLNSCRLCAAQTRSIHARGGGDILSMGMYQRCALIYRRHATVPLID